MLTPILEYEIDRPGAKIRSLGFTVERMVAEEGLFERRTGQQSPLKTFYDVWATTTTFEPAKHSEIWIQNIDTSSESPLGFVWHRHTGLTFGNLSGRAVGSLTNRFLREACAIEYTAAKHIGQPIYHVIEQTIDGMHRKYTRLIIPDSEQVLYYVYRLIDPPRPVSVAPCESA